MKYHLQMKRIIFLAFILFAFTANAKRKHYDPRMRMVGITEIGTQPRQWDSNWNFMFVRNDIDIPEIYLTDDANAIETALNNKQIGKRILDYLFEYDGAGLSEKRLRKRAYVDANLDDHERASVTLIGKRQQLEEDYLPVLKNNYIYVEMQRHWYVFHVDITRETWNQVFNAWNDMVAYNQIEVPVRFYKKGRIPKKGRDHTTQFRKVGKKVPEFALRGKVESRNPFVGSMGATHGVKNGDRFLVMRNFANDREAGSIHIYSKKIATVRASRVDYDKTFFHTIAGGGPSAKNADILVHRPDKKVYFSVEGLYQTNNKMPGARLTGAWMTKFLRHGWTLYTIGTVGCNLFSLDKSPMKENDYSQMSFSVGNGLGYSFLRRFEITPYYQVGADIVSTKDKFPYSENEDGTYNYQDVTWAVRGMLGARININVFYPLQLTAGGEYYISFGEDIYKCMTETYGIKRSDLVLFAGLKYNF